MTFTAGACPLDAGGSVVAVGDVAGQTRQVMANLVAALEGAGVGLCDVLKTTVYVATTDRNDLVAAWDVVREAMDGHDAPSTLVGVTVLGYPDQLVEVEAIAIRDSWPDPGPPDDADVVPECPPARADRDRATVAPRQVAPVRHRQGVDSDWQPFFAALAGVAGVVLAGVLVVLELASGRG